MAAELDPALARSQRWLSRSPEATERLGEALARALVPGDVVALLGELGAGKTCLVRGVARALDVTEPVTSPTFTLMHQYAGRVPLYHLDAWMQARGEAFLQDGGAEWLSSGGIALVEWAERVAAWLPRRHLRVELEHVAGDARRIAIEWRGAPERELVRGAPEGCEALP